MSVVINGVTLKNATCNGEKVKKIYYNDGTTNHLIYSAEELLLGEGVNNLGTLSYSLEGSGSPSAWLGGKTLTKNSDKSYTYYLFQGGTQTWMTAHGIFGNKISNNGYQKLIVKYKIESDSKIEGSGSLKITINNDKTILADSNTKKNTSLTVSIDISSLSSFTIDLSSMFSAGDVHKITFTKIAIE